MILKYTNTNYNIVKDVLKKEFNISKNLILKLKNNDRIFLNGISTYANHELKVNDIVTVNLDFEEDNSNIIPIELNLDIIYEDEAYLVINKPCGIAIHPSCNHYDSSLSSGVKNYFDKTGLKRKTRPVNRLDKDTSGIVIFAKNEYVQECLVKQMISKTFIKEYVGILHGVLENKSGIIDAPIARNLPSIIERCVSQDGEKSITRFEVLQEFNDISLVKFILETGRTHQIRVHSKHIGHPLLGDTLYGTESSLIDRQALHAYRVNFIHPLTKKNVEYIAEIPDDIKNIIKEVNL